MIIRLNLFLFFMLSGISVLAQNKNGYYRAASGLVSNQKETIHFTAPASEPGHTVSLFPTEFAESQFKANEATRLLNSIRGHIIEKVQLVYTSYRQSPDFDQKALNAKRLSAFYNLLPEAFANAQTEWELVSQTGANSPEEGRSYFHGFVIYWRPDPSTESMKSEISKLDSIFSPKEKKESSTSETSSGSTSSDGGHAFSSGSKTLTLPDGTKMTLDRSIPEDSLWMYIKPSGSGYSVINARYGDTAHTTVIVTEMSEAGYQRKRVWKLEDHKSETPFTPHSLISLGGNIQDSVFSSVIRRNNWHNTVFVADVTGSMSPYTAQLFAWLSFAANSNECAGFVFFNDGDKKSNGSKSVGKTGGIYSTKSHQYDSVYATAREAMKNGDGGDAVENDLEALIYAINELHPTGDIVLIADNWGPPRDLELFEKIKRPVHIILCGARGGVNPDYLFLARQFNGTLHTLNDDITNLGTMQDGETVKIGHQTFLLHEEHFIPLENFSKALGY
jgi:hypothetical protein